MADLDFEFDPNSVEPGMDFTPVPAGDYAAQITESNVAPPKSGNGLMLNLTWEIVEGEYDKRKFWQRINYKHMSAQAQLIGQQQLKAICDAIGLQGHLTDSEMLHFQPCRVRLSIDHKNKDYDPKNEVKSVKPLQADAPTTKPAVVKAAVAQQATKPVTTQATKPATGQTRPWGNRKTA